MKPSSTPAEVSATFEIGGVGGDRGVSRIGQPPEADRTRGRTRPNRDPGFGVRIGGRKPYAVAPVGKAGQHELAGLRTPRRHRVHVGASETKPAETVVAVAHPCAVIDALTHRLAVFPVARDIDADASLLPHNAGDGGPQLFLKLTLVHRLACLPGAVRLDQIVRARQATDMAGQNVIGAGPHDPPFR